MAAFESDERGNPPTRSGCHNLVGGRRKGEVSGESRNEAADEVNLFEGHDDRLSSAEGRRRIDRPELATHLTRAKAWDIGVDAGHGLREVDHAQVVVA